MGEILNFTTYNFAKGPMILDMVMTIVFTPWSHYNAITEPCSHCLFFLLEGLSINFPSHMIVSMIDIFPLAITRILTHMQVPIRHALIFLP